MAHRFRGWRLRRVGGRGCGEATSERSRGRGGEADRGEDATAAGDIEGWNEGLEAEQRRHGKRRRAERDGGGAAAVADWQSGSCLAVTLARERLEGGDVMSSGHRWIRS